jgi:glucose/arabinose dehydrogenase
VIGKPSSRAGRHRLLSLGTAFILTATLTVGAVNPSVAGAVADLAAVKLALRPVASGLASPVALAWRSGDARMYVAEQGGRVRIIDPTTGAVVGTALTVAGVTASGERGLLGLTFSLDGTKLYVDYTDSAGTIHVVEYPMSGDLAVVASARELLSIPHPRTNHNGGEVTIGPDGYLYIGTGDGGGAGDPDLNGQNVDVLLGKILRIDPTPSDLLPYTIPPDNPFVGLANHREEIWMYGLRNPWRFTFDRANGDLWIADVGQGLYEEVDYAPAGESGSNWGWNLREGFHAYAGAQPPDGQDPLFEKAHSDGYCAVIGGYVYRGSAIANLNGAYVFGDLCRSVLSAVVQTGGAVTDQIDFGVGASQITTFGEDHDGELYVANLGGVVYKLVEPPPPHVSVGDKALLEGDSVNRAISIPVTLSQPATSPVTVQYSVSAIDATGGTKQLPGVDFKLKSGTLTFNVNNSGVTPISKNVSVTVYGDTGVEPNEMLRVTLSSPTNGYGLGRATATGTILNDDGGASGVTLGIGDASIEQQALGAEKLAIPVTLSAKMPSTTVTVNYTITPGSASYSTKASGGGEFGGKLTGTVKFIPDATLRSISVSIWPDLTADADHQFTIALSGLVGSGVTLIRATGTGTVLDP